MFGCQSNENTAKTSVLDWIYGDKTCRWPCFWWEILYIHCEKQCFGRLSCVYVWVGQRHWIMENLRKTLSITVYSRVWGNKWMERIWSSLAWEAPTGRKSEKNTPWKDPRGVDPNLGKMLFGECFWALSSWLLEPGKNLQCGRPLHAKRGELHHATLRYLTLVTVQYFTLRYSTLHYATVHYITLYTNRNYSYSCHYHCCNYIPLRYLHHTTLHCITLLCTPLHFTTLCYTVFNYIPRHYPYNHSYTSNITFTALRSAPFH